MNDPFDISNLPKGMKIENNISIEDLINNKPSLKDENYVKMILDNLADIENFDLKPLAIQVNENDDGTVLNIVLSIEKRGE